VQVGRHFEYIDRAFYRRIMALTIPLVILCLLVVTTLKINIGIVVGLFLMLVALKNLSPRISKLIESMVRYEKSYFAAMGIIHAGRISADRS
jgi:hypothetical protein